MLFDFGASAPKSPPPLKLFIKSYDTELYSIYSWHWINTAVLIGPQSKEAKVRRRLKTKRMLQPEEKRMMEYLIDEEAEVTSGDRYVLRVEFVIRGLGLGLFGDFSS